MADRAQNPWQHRRIFITGATGLLGLELVAELVARDAEVTCLVRDWVPASRLLSSGAVSGANVVSGDLTDQALLVRVLNEYEIDSVFHLGAQTIVGTASRSPVSTFESNIRGTWSLLEACRLNARLVERVVVASSDKAYGIADRLPYTEEAPLQGRYPYDVSKSCADLIALSYFHTYRTPVAVTRCGNLWGPGDLNYNRLIPGTIRSALLDDAPIIRSDGTFRRDYFYVKDAVHAYLTLAERMKDDDLSGQAFNFGNEQPVSVIDVVNTILRVTGKSSLTPVILNEATGEIPDQFLDCAKARRALNWAPRYTFETGLAETIPWYRRGSWSTDHATPNRPPGATPRDEARERTGAPGLERAPALEVVHVESWKTHHVIPCPQKPEVRRVSESKIPSRTFRHGVIDIAVGIGEMLGRDAESAQNRLMAAGEFVVQLGLGDGGERWMVAAVRAYIRSARADVSEIVPRHQRQRRYLRGRPSAPGVGAADVISDDEDGGGQTGRAQTIDDASHVQKPIVERDRHGVFAVVGVGQECVQIEHAHAAAHEPRQMCVEGRKRHGNRRPAAVNRMVGENGPHEEGRVVLLLPRASRLARAAETIPRKRSITTSSDQRSRHAS